MNPAPPLSFLCRLAPPPPAAAAAAERRGAAAVQGEWRTGELVLLHGDDAAWLDERPDAAAAAAAGGPEPSPERGPRPGLR